MQVKTEGGGEGHAVSPRGWVYCSFPQVKWKRFTQSFLVPEIFLNTKHMCDFKQSFDCLVHICFGFRSKLDSVKFQFVFHCRRNLD